MGRVSARPTRKNTMKKLTQKIVGGIVAITLYLLILVAKIVSGFAILTVALAFSDAITTTYTPLSAGDHMIVAQAAVYITAMIGAGKAAWDLNNKINGMAEGFRNGIKKIEGGVTC